MALRHRPFRRAARPVRRLSALEVVITLTDIPTEPRSAVVTARGTRVLVVFGLLTGAAVGLGAQGNAQCNVYAAGPFGNSREANVCNAGVDGASVFAPVAGILITGGNPFLGATGGLGGFPHLGLTLRANATSVVVPDFSYNGVGTIVAAKQTILAPAPLIEAALGVFRGLGHGNLALDVLGSAQLLPTTLIDDVHIDVNARRIGSIALGLGVGARVTLLGERQAVPAVTVSLMRRTLPRIGVGNIVGGDSYEFASDLASTEYRATVGKRIGPLDLGAGAGWSDYTAAAEIVFGDARGGAAGLARHQGLAGARLRRRRTGFRVSLPYRRGWIATWPGSWTRHDLHGQRPGGEPDLRQHRSALWLLTTCSISRSWASPSAWRTAAGA